MTAAMRHSLVAFPAMLTVGLSLTVSAQADVLSSPHGQQQAVRQAQHTALCGLQAELARADSDAVVAAKISQGGLMNPQEAAMMIANDHHVSRCPAVPAS